MSRRRRASRPSRRSSADSYGRSCAARGRRIRSRSSRTSVSNSTSRCVPRSSSPSPHSRLSSQPDHVRTIEDALANLTLPEPLPDFVNRTGVRVEATKQVYLETFPPVLILHLKRFLYDNVGGVQKSGKSIGYGTELEIREDIIAPTKRMGKLVRYQLFGGTFLSFDTSIAWLTPLSTQSSTTTASRRKVGTTRSRCGSSLTRLRGSTSTIRLSDQSCQEMLRSRREGRAREGERRGRREPTFSSTQDCSLAEQRAVDEIAQVSACSALALLACLQTEKENR